MENKSITNYLPGIIGLAILATIIIYAVASKIDFNSNNQQSVERTPAPTITPFVTSQTVAPTAIPTISQTPIATPIPSPSPTVEPATPTPSPQIKTRSLKEDENIDEETQSTYENKKSVKNVLQERPSRDEESESELTVLICPITALKATKYCRDKRLVTYAKGEEPKEFCPFHVP